VGVIKNFVNKIISDIFPENYTCIACNAEMDHDDKYVLCDKCKKDIAFIDDKSCQVCGARIFADTHICTDCMANSRVVDRNYSAVVYDGVMKKLIHDYKYGGKEYLCRPLGSILYDKYLAVRDQIDADIIIPVPLNANRERDRGFNQATMMLHQFDIDADKINDKVLARIKDTPQQMSLPKDKRLDNVKGAFEVLDVSAVMGANVLLVDDIYTTGSTIDECARMLYDAGANVVRSITLANAHIERATEMTEDEYI